MAETGKEWTQWWINCLSYMCLYATVQCRTIFKLCGGFVILGELYPDKWKIKGCHIIVNRLIYWYFDCVCLHQICVAGCFLDLAARGASRATLTAGDEEKQKFLLWLIFPFKDEEGQRKAARNCYIMRHQERDRKTNMKTRDEENVFGVLRAVSWWLGVWMVVLWLRFNEYWSWDHVSTRHPGIISK